MGQREPKNKQNMNTNNSETQPAPVLAWHREAAEDMRNYFKKPMLFRDIPDPLHAMIAQRDPHAETVRLLEEVTNHLHELIKDEFDDPSVGIVGWNGEHELVADARTHLAKLKGTQ